MAATIAMTDEPVALNEAPFLSLFLLSFWLGLFGLVSPGLFWSPGLFGVTATLVNSTVTPLPMALPFRTVDRGQRGLLGIRLGGVGDRALGQFVGGRNLHRIGLVAAVILDLHPQFMTGGGMDLVYEAGVVRPRIIPVIGGVFCE